MRLKQRNIIKNRLTARTSDLTERDRQLGMHAAFNEAAMNAWFATALEQTKAVFTLGSAGVGLTMTIAFSDGAGSYPCSFAPVWLVLSGVLFAICSAFCIVVFRANTKVVGLLVDKPDLTDEQQRQRDQKADDAAKFVGRFDRGARGAFGIAMVLALLAMISKVWGVEFHAILTRRGCGRKLGRVMW